MINWNDTNLVWSEPRKILTASISLVTEGQGLVHAFESGTPKVTPGTGSTGDQFLGIAMGPRLAFHQNQRIDTVVVPATGPYTVLLSRTVNAAPGMYQVGGTLVAASSSAASTTNVQYTVDATTGLTLLTFDPSFAGATFTATYTYIMSTTEEAGLFGNVYPGASPEALLANVSVLTIGRVAVNNYSPTANWFAGGGLPTVKLIAGGIWTDSANAATGIVPTNVRVIALPSGATPYLTLELR